MNPYQNIEYEQCLKELSNLWLFCERHWGDYIKDNTASIRIDIKTKLYKHELKKLLFQFLEYKLLVRLHKWKKSRWSGMNNYLLHYEIILPQ